MKNGETKNNLGISSFFVSLFLFACILFGFFVSRQGASRNIATIAFLDVGQGDAIFVEAPNGTQMLVDAGSSSVVVGELSKVMSFWDRTIDVVVPTHADKDHIGGFPEVFRRFNVLQVYDTSNDATTAVFQEYERMRDLETDQIFLAGQGDTIMLDADAGMYARVLFPVSGLEGITRNDSSTVIQVVFGDIEIMLTGDAGTMVEDYLVYEYGEGLRSEILKAGHHGSRTSTSELFLDTVSPEVVIISAGKDNSYGHPHEDVITNISNRNISILETAQNGTIVFETDGVTAWLK